ncbi:hypothetical protein PCE1_002830 [Barthelona sp. PCE]
MPRRLNHGAQFNVEGKSFQFKWSDDSLTILSSESSSKEEEFIAQGTIFSTAHAQNVPEFTEGTLLKCYNCNDLFYTFGRVKSVDFFRYSHETKEFTHDSRVNNLISNDYTHCYFIDRNTFMHKRSANRSTLNILDDTDNVAETLDSPFIYLGSLGQFLFMKNTSYIAPFRVVTQDNGEKQFVELDPVAPNNAHYYFANGASYMILSAYVEDFGYENFVLTYLKGDEFKPLYFLQLFECLRKCPHNIKNIELFMLSVERKEAVFIGIIEGSYCICTIFNGVLSCHPLLTNGKKLFIPQHTPEFAFEFNALQHILDQFFTENNNIYKFSFKDSLPLENCLFNLNSFENNIIGVINDALFYRSKDYFVIFDFNKNIVWKQDFFNDFSKKWKEYIPSVHPFSHNGLFHVRNRENNGFLTKLHEYYYDFNTFYSKHPVIAHKITSSLNFFINWVTPDGFIQIPQSENSVYFYKWGEVAPTLLCQLEDATIVSNVHYYDNQTLIISQGGAKKKHTIFKKIDNAFIITESLSNDIRVNAYNTDIRIVSKNEGTEKWLFNSGDDSEFLLPKFEFSTFIGPQLMLCDDGIYSINADCSIEKIIIFNFVVTACNYSFYLGILNVIVPDISTRQFHHIRCEIDGNIIVKNEDLSIDIEDFFFSSDIHSLDDITVVSGNDGAPLSTYIRYNRKIEQNVHRGYLVIQ